MNPDTVIATRRPRRHESPVVVFQYHSPYRSWKGRVYGACRLLKSVSDQAEAMLEELGGEMREEGAADRLRQDIATLRTAAAMLQDSHLLTRYSA